MILLLIPLLLMLAALAVAGLLSGDCLTAVTVACLRVRYAAGAAEAASGLGILGAAVFASAAAGAALMLRTAGRAAGDWSDRAAATLIPSPEGFLDG